jgi:hypothetical protein
MNADEREEQSAEPTESRLGGVGGRSPLTVIVTRHLRAGFVGLFVFIVLGAILETLHATKSPFFVDAGQETARLLTRLAHAHGTLISLVNVVFALVVRARPAVATPASSSCLLASLVLIPLGFLVGGFFAHGGDPGLGIVLVPPGAICLAIAMAISARRA